MWADGFAVAEQALAVDLVAESSGISFDVSAANVSNVPKLSLGRILVICVLHRTRTDRLEIEDILILRGRRAHESGTQ